MGKNFDGTGVFGPAFVTADALPPGCKGLDLTTRLNGEVVQHAPIAAMVVDVETLVSLLSGSFHIVPRRCDRDWYAKRHRHVPQASPLDEAGRRLRGGDLKSRHIAHADHLTGCTCHEDAES